MKIVIAGGTGYLGTLLIAHYSKDPSNKIFVLTRTPQLHKAHVNYIKWDGKTKDYWCNFMENTDLLINLTGKSVNCRYTETNKNTIYERKRLLVDVSPPFHAVILFFFSCDFF